MSAMVYKARRDDAGAVVVDWVIADTLDDLSGKIAEGWVTSEAKAREAVADAPVATEAAPAPEPSPATDEPAPSTDEPASEPKSRKSAKKK